MDYADPLVFKQALEFFETRLVVFAVLKIIHCETRYVRWIR